MLLVEGETRSWKEIGWSARARFPSVSFQVGRTWQAAPGLQTIRRVRISSKIAGATFAEFLTKTREKAGLLIL